MILSKRTSVTQIGTAISELTDLVNDRASEASNDGDFEALE